MRLLLLATSVPVEDVRAGDQVVVSRKVGARPVLRVERYEPHEADCRERFVVVYEPAGPGAAWEHRGPTSYRRDGAALAVKERGARVEIAARGDGETQLALSVHDSDLDGLSWDDWFRALPPMLRVMEGGRA